jgi:hypothetical protein
MASFCDLIRDLDDYAYLCTTASHGYHFRAFSVAVAQTAMIHDLCMYSMSYVDLLIFSFKHLTTNMVQFSIPCEERASQLVYLYR